MKYSDKQRLEKIADYCEKLLDFLSEKHITRQILMDDYTVQWAVTTPLYNIGEHVYLLSDDFKHEHSEIPWSMISGLRHRLVHNYEGTNWSIIVEVVFDELPTFAQNVTLLLSHLT
ncbi:MAG: DUF86 domain-containing protein [Oscillospiraceae bacterium]|nr:DUF86 domain-containing protein [Oscillospiraceae bacterium]